MQKNKGIIILLSILVVLIIIIIFLFFSIKNKSEFKEIPFDKSSSINIPKDINYEDSILEIADGYSIYISPSPKIVDNNYLKIDFISIETNNIWIKVRILDENDNILGESELIKPGEYLEKIKIKKNLKSQDKIIYKIMGYEKESYYSAGTISLNTKVGA